MIYDYWEKYDEWISHYDFIDMEMTCLKKHGINFEKKRILEIGSGTGRFTKKVLPYCESITCVDKDRKALATLQATLANSKMQIICGTLESVSLNSDYYDYVVFSWSLYLISNQQEVLELAKKYLKSNGKIIVLQPMPGGEYEKEVAHLYKSYDPIGAYNLACKEFPSLISSLFENVVTDSLTAYFEFDNIDQVIDCALFFIEDEEGQLPDDDAVLSLKNRLQAYLTPEGKVKLSDEIFVIIGEKKAFIFRNQD